MRLNPAILFCFALATPSFAEGPEIVDVNVEKASMGWRFEVTIEHPDTGWDHYADGWEVLDSEGNQLGLRVLHHPHVDEQPFTRSLSSVTVPDGTRTVYVRARCSVDGWDREAVPVDLPF